MKEVIDIKLTAEFLKRMQRDYPSNMVVSISITDTIAVTTMPTP